MVAKKKKKKKQDCEVKERGRECFKGECKAMKKSQKMCDNCSICDFFLRTKNGGTQREGKEYIYSSLEKQGKCIQAWGIEGTWSYADKM